MIKFNIVAAVSSAAMSAFSALPEMPAEFMADREAVAAAARKATPLAYPDAQRLPSWSRPSWKLSFVRAGYSTMSVLASRRRRRWSRLLCERLRMAMPKVSCSF